MVILNYLLNVMKYLEDELILVFSEHEIYNGKNLGVLNRKGFIEPLAELRLISDQE